MNKPITSREYKLILNADRFKDRQPGTEAFWELIECLVEKLGGKAGKKAKEEENMSLLRLGSSQSDVHPHIYRVGRSCPSRTRQIYLWKFKPNQICLDRSDRWAKPV